MALPYEMAKQLHVGVVDMNLEMELMKLEIDMVNW